MPDDPFDSLEFQDYARHVRDELIPRLDQSALSISLVPEGVGDVKFAVELGLSIMMDKPIIAVVTPGVQVPQKLALVADEIIEGGLDDPTTLARLNEAIDRILENR
jgi:hypothetical protein